MSRVIPDERIQLLNSKDPARGKYTLYWMQQAQRAECNHALEFAIQRANARGNRLLVCFGLTDDYPEANLRHFQFMLEGLQETAQSLHHRSIPVAVRRGEPADVAIPLGRDATEVVCDRGYLRHQRQWRDQVARSLDCRVWQVETDAIVPIEQASDRAEYAARTIRPKLMAASERFLTPLTTTPIDKDSLNLGIRGVDLGNLDELIGELSIDRSVRPLADINGGTRHAKQRLKKFLSEHLSNYATRTLVVEPPVSYLSAWLHFGQISPLEIALRVGSSRGHETDQKAAFMEQLLVRRELSINFVYFHQHYDSLKCLPDWARETLQQHDDDQRDPLYTAAELEEAETHDDAWNAAMLQMKATGYLHNHLRMYWGKKILHWTSSHAHAYRTALSIEQSLLPGRSRR